MKKKFYVGGQALIEGVMMKTPNWVGAAARTPEGRIVKTRKRHISLTQKSWILRLPIIRGIIFLGEMMAIGIKMLNWSADQQAEEEEKLGFWQTGLTILLSLSLAIAIFVIAPCYLARFFTETRGIAFNLIDGAFRV
ncbi:MAG: DUF1385 domain-containing protein, partial [Candidatus Woesearchaeota archaeon]